MANHRFVNHFGKAGIVLNPEKFQFAERAIEFAGFHVSESSIEPLPSTWMPFEIFPVPKTSVIYVAGQSGV